MIRLGNKYNRSYDLYFQYRRDHFLLNILFNRNNLYTAFNVDKPTYQTIKNSDARIDMFFDIHKSLFCDTYLELRDLKTQTIDIKNQYHSILPEFRSIVRCEMNETIQIEKNITQNNSFENVVNINVFRFVSHGTDFLYCLIERIHSDQTTKKKVGRTAGFQITTRDAYLYMVEICQKRACKNIVESQTCDEAFKGMFESDMPKTNRGGLM